MGNSLDQMGLPVQKNRQKKLSNQVTIKLIPQTKKNGLDHKSLPE
jgi:hypothetical protein